MRTLPRETEMYRALVERDASYEGVFFASVRTTGIFCRPTCRARKPKPENVEYFATATEALHAGYRPCKVCRPLDVAPDRPAWATDLMARVEAEPGRRLTDADLRRMDVDPVRARRWFRRHFGVTFQAYQRAWRLGTAMQGLRGGAAVTATAYDSGFESESGFREAFARLFGHAPGRVNGAPCLLAHWLTTPLGAMIAIASDTGVALLEFVDRRALEREIAQLRRALCGTVVPGRNRHLDQLERELAEYFAGERERFDVALETPGTPFQRAVWERLRDIPYGETTSYAEIGAAVGRPNAPRAVGRANGTNRVSIVVPCHRVVRSDGTICGYGGGVWRKRFLLDLEGAGVTASHE